MRARRLLLAAGLLAACAAPFWGPPLLRRVPWFAAARVEVSGTRLLAPHEALAASGVEVGANVWLDPGPWEAALRRHPAVEDAEVRRRLPRTLRIRVREKRPAALVEAGTLRPATAAGELLPADPVRVPLDLPLLRGPAAAGDSGRVGDPGTRRALAETGRLAELDPALMGRVSEIRPARGEGGVELTLTAPAAHVRVPAGVDGAGLARLRAALEHLERRMAPDEAGRIVVDLRFADQVVVRTES